MTSQPIVQSFNTGVAGADDLCRLHLSENHYGLHEVVRLAVEEELKRIHLYPDPDCNQVRQRLAEQYGVTPDMIIVGNGTDEILLLLTLALLGPGKVGLTSESTFPGYKVSTALSGAQTKFVPMGENYRIPAPELAAAAHGTDAVFVCNPHNPTGSSLSATDLQDFLEKATEAGSVPVIDEAYADFADQPFPSAIPFIRDGGRAIVMRTFSKSHSLAGFRIGYAVGAPDLIAKLQTVRSALPFSVNRLAQVAALTAMDHPEFLEEIRTSMHAVKHDLYTELDRLHIPYVPSQTNFVLIEVPQSVEFSRKLLQEHGILTRETTPFGYPGHIRLSLGTQEQMKVAVRALELVKGELS